MKGDADHLTLHLDESDLEREAGHEHSRGAEEGQGWSPTSGCLYWVAVLFPVLVLLCACAMTVANGVCFAFPSVGPNPPQCADISRYLITICWLNGYCPYDAASLLLC